MAHKKMYAIAPMRYGTRMLKAGDPVTMSAPEALLNHALGRVTAKRPKKPEPVAVAMEPDPVVVEPEPIQAEPVDDISELRDAYQAKFEKRPYHGWDADALRARMAEG